MKKGRRASAIARLYVTQKTRDYYKEIEKRKLAGEALDADIAAMESTAGHGVPRASLKTAQGAGAGAGAAGTALTVYGGGEGTEAAGTATARHSCYSSTVIFVTL